MRCECERLPAPVGDFFCHLPAYGPLVCRSCESAVIPRQVKTHLATKHRQAVSPKQGAVISEAVLQLAKLATQPQDVRYSNSSYPPLPHLVTIDNAFRCTPPSTAIPSRVATSGVEYGSCSSTAATLTAGPTPTRRNGYRFSQGTHRRWFPGAQV